MVKTMVSCRFSLKPIHWGKSWMLAVSPAPCGNRSTWRPGTHLFSLRKRYAKTWLAMDLVIVLSDAWAARGGSLNHPPVLLGKPMVAELIPYMSMLINMDIYGHCGETHGCWKRSLVMSIYVHINHHTSERKKINFSGETSRDLLTTSRHLLTILVKYRTHMEVS